MMEKRRVLGPGAHGKQVAALHAALLGSGIDVAHDELVENMFAAGTRLAVLQFQRMQQMTPTGVADEPLQDVLAEQREAQRDPQRYVVGWVLNPDGKPAAGVTVRAFDRDIRSERILGEAKSEDDGFYRIDYSRAGGKDAVGTPDVFVRAYVGRTQLTEPTLEDTVFNSDDLVSITVVLPKRTRPRETDFERVRRVATPAMADLAWQDLQEDASHRDVTFLQRETELPRHEIDHMALAARLSQESGGAAECWYAIFATDTLVSAHRWATLTPLLDLGVNTPSGDVLYATAALEPEVRRQAVRRAVEEFVVPRSALEQVAEFETVMEKHRSAAQENQRRERVQVAFTQLQGFVQSQAREEVLNLLQQDPLGDIGGLLDKLQEAGIVATEHAKQVTTDFALADLVAGDDGLLQRLRKKHRITKPEEVRKLAQLDDTEWVSAIQEGSNVSRERAETQARVLARRMEQQFPTTAFAARLKRDGDAVLARGSDVAQVLEENPEFDLARGNAVRLLKDHEEKKRARSRRRSPLRADELAAQAALRSSLLATQRVFKLAPRYAQASALLSRGLTSASDITALGRSRFLSLALETGEFDAAQARRAYAKAADMQAASLLLAGQIRAASDATSIAALGTMPLALDGVTAEFPTMQTLFGGGDMCACEECRSVHGAAAYLVDTLAFLKNRLVLDTTAAPAVSLRQAKDVLFARRPDLGDTDLSCPNTSTPLPYIDMVCELLEDAVAPDAGVAFSGAVVQGVADPALVAALRGVGWPFTEDSVVSGPDLTGNFVVRDKSGVARLTPNGPAWVVRRLRQTFGSAEEVAAAPEYVNQAAYVTLAGARTAFGLPFDLAHAETAAFFKLLDLRRSDLMTLLDAGGVAAAAAAADRLGLSDAEHDLVVTADPTGQDTIWTTTNAATALANVDAFVTRSGVTYTKLLELLDLPWVDAGANLFIRHLDSSCDLNAKEIANLDTHALDRLHRFVRLQRAVDLPSTVLDRAIRHGAVGAGALDNPCLVHMAQLLSVASALRMTADAVLDLLGPLETTSATYQREFLNENSTGEIEADFRPAAVAKSEADEASTPGSGLRLTDYEGYLARALGAKATDVAALIREQGADPALTTASITRVRGLWRLAKALRMSVTDLLGLLVLTGVNPLASLDALLSTATSGGIVRVSGSTVARLTYLLNHDAPDLAIVEPGSQSITDFVTGLDAALKAAAESTSSPYNPQASPLENTTAVLANAALIPGVSPDDQSRLATLLADAWTDPAQTESAYLDATFAEYFDTTDVKAAVTARAAAAPAAKEAACNAVIEEFARGVSAYLFDRARNVALTAAVVELTGLAEDQVDAIVGHARVKQGVAGTPVIRDVLLDDSGTAAATDAKQRAARLSVKITAAAAAYRPSAELLAWLLDHAEDLGWLEWDRLPYGSGQTAATFDAWLRLHSFFGLVAAYPDVAHGTDASPYSVAGFFDLVLDPATTAVDALTYAAVLTGLDPATCVDIDTHLGLSLTDLKAYHDPATMGRVVAAASMLRQLAVDTSTGVALCKNVLTFADALALRAAVKTRYADKEWLGVLGQIQDQLRMRKRDALVAYLLATNPTLKSSNDLYDHYLIDVETASCMDTSRIVQAHATVQLFVQRCLMGLEPESVANVKHDDGWKQWEWMANFRVWEANRKIFLWPENWLEPELRDDKSELFATLEETLEQNPLTDVSVEDTTSAYLESLGDIAHLDVLASYYEARTKTTHVFAKTKGGDPAIYLHREFQQERYWTPWQRVPIDITGEHLLAFDRNSRITVAWPIFTEEPDTSAAPPATPDPASLGGGKPNEKPKKRWKIQLAVSERANGEWRPKRVSQGFLATDFAQDLPKVDEFNFFVWGFGATQSITCVGPHGSLGSFALTGCKGYPEPNPTGHFHGRLYPRFVDTKMLAGRFTEQNIEPGEDLTVVQLLEIMKSKILGVTPGKFKITYPMQISVVDWVLIMAQIWLGSQTSSAALKGYPRNLGIPLGTLMPYFFADYERTYVVVPGFYDLRPAPRPSAAGAPAEAASRPRTRKMFSDVHQLVLDIIALVMKYLNLYAKDPGQPIEELIGKFLVDPECIRITEELKVYGKLSYGLDFRNFYHPLVCAFRTELNRAGIPGLLNGELQKTDTGFDFADTYDPTTQVIEPYPREDVDFSLDGAYSSYNWELFFHLPFAMAKRLNRDQQFEAARQWYHYIFNPIGAADAPAPRKYWNTKPFAETTPTQYLEQRIDAVLGAIAADPSGATITELAFAVSQWRDKPFRPHVVARSRPVAYQVATVLAYVQNLVDWGDHLFRQFTRESITQATQLYVLADKLLGRKPRVVPPAVPTPPKTYNELERDVDIFGNALLDLEALVPDLGLLPQEGQELPPAPATLTSLYFCIPPNSKMLEIWDLVADRLLKIRNCRNIEGIEMPLALFSPPIDPGALARAVAGGMSISSFVAGLGAPLPHYRFSVLSRKAAELANQVGGLGSELLSVLERRDGEALSRLRAQHEIALLDAMREVKVATLAEAEGSVEALRRSRDVVVGRREYYESQEYMNSAENVAAALSSASLTGELAVALGYVLSGGLKLIPDFVAGAAGFGGSPTVNASMGGQQIGNSAEMAVATLSSIARAADKGASMALTQAGYDRRSEEWQFQVQQADSELAHIDVQITNAELHLETLRKDLAAHDKQKTQAEIESAALHSKFSNQELYEWMAEQISSVYYKAYQLAFDVAKKAERCFGYELASDKTFIKYGYWDTRHKGLMAHQGLEQDIARMESAYLADNKREYELTKHISLAQLDPAALLRLKATGKTTITVPEVAFDIDYPSHFMRRIKTAAVTLVCSAGPYTTVSATLTLVSNKYRKSTEERQGVASDKEKYAEVVGSDPRFAYNVGSVASIATSSAATDSGVFELNFHDERYLPFEGAGAISTWQIELPTVFEQVDRSTITDLVLHLRYTAREGGSTLKSLTEAALVELSNEMTLSANNSGWYAGISLREHLSTAWWQLTSTGQTVVELGTEHLPFAVREHDPTISEITWVATVDGEPASYSLTVDGAAVTLNRDPQMQRLCLAPTSGHAFGDQIPIAANPDKLQDLFLLIHYTLTPS